jgi:hypothetical protein
MRVHHVCSEPWTKSSSIQDEDTAPRIAGVTLCTDGSVGDAEVYSATPPTLSRSICQMTQYLATGPDYVAAHQEKVQFATIDPETKHPNDIPSVKQDIYKYNARSSLYFICIIFVIIDE